jgi:hypothetical protein
MKVARGVQVLSSLCLFVLGQAAWAETYPLDSIDFASQGQRTAITLHTGSIVPVDKVMVSSDKVMIDIDQIDATQTIRTNFANASNISHVIIQPINEHKVRLIIRGEGLSNPILSFEKISMPEDNTMSMHALSESQPTPMMPALSAPKTTASANTMTNKQGKGVAKKSLDNTDATLDTLLLNDDSSADVQTEPSSVAPPVSAFAAPMNAHTPVSMPAQTSRKPIELQAPLTLPDSSGSKAKAVEPGIDTATSLQPLLGYVPYGALFLALSILGFLLGQKLKQRKLQGDSTTEEDWIDTPRQDRRIDRRQNFRELAEAYRSRHQDTVPNHVSHKISDAPRGSSTKEDLIGLSALQANQESPTLAPLPAQPKTASASSPSTKAASALHLEQILEAMQKQKSQATNNTPTQNAASLPKKRTVNPYAPPVASKTPPQKKPALPQQPLAAKPLSAPGLPSTPMNQATAAKRTAPMTAPNARSRQQDKQQQGPLPGNPEVLNFLRNVADLMEKDGKTNIAQNIHKNLNTQSAGLVK